MMPSQFAILHADGAVRDQPELEARCPKPRQRLGRVGEEHTGIWKSGTVIVQQGLSHAGRKLEPRNQISEHRLPWSVSVAIELYEGLNVLRRYSLASRADRDRIYQPLGRCRLAGTMKTGPVSIHPGLVAVVLISATSAWLLAQQEIPQPPPIFRSTADVVRVEASVLDKDRRAVRGLQAGDFSVLENGQERPLVAFAPIELPPAAPASIAGAAWLRDAPRDVVSNGGADAGRLVVIAFDWSIRFYDQATARRIALAAVDGLGPTDDAAVVFTKPNAAAGKPQGFTADRSLLRAAINQPFAVALTQPDWTIVDPDGYDTTAGECLCGICTLEALTGLGQTLRTVSQRPKVLLFIGTYVRTFDAMRATKPVVKPGTITDAYSITPGWTDCPGRLRDARRAFERAMGEANVTVHVLDPVGLDTEGTTPLGPKRIRERLDSLPVIADMTGGRTVLNTNAPEAHVAAILEESAAYYVLGFTPAPPVKGETTRRIEVRVRPRDVTVRARREYTVAERPTASAPAQGVLTRAMAEVLPERSVPLEVSAVAMIAGDRSAAVLIGRLGEGAARPTAVVTAAFTPRAAPVVSRRITIAPTTAGRGTGSRALGLVSALALEAGSYRDSPGHGTARRRRRQRAHVRRHP